jgi:hypothetical protein
VAKRATQGFRLTAEERAKAKAEWNSSQEAIPKTDGYQLKEEVPSPPTDNFRVEEAPKARTEDNQVSAPAINLSPDSLQLASLALGVTNSAVVVMFGQECGLYDNEKKLLYPSLSRVINRMPASSAAKASVFIDPLVLLFGLAVWVNRIAAIKSKERTEANAVTAREFAAASGVNWDVSRGEQVNPPGQHPIIEPNGSAPGTVGEGTTGVVPQTGPNTGNANGVIGKVPDIITDLGNPDITGGNV